ncbi:MAG: FAD-binding domain-containing protein [Pseudomonadota bacterium]
MNKLQKTFSDRNELIDYVATLSPWLTDRSVSHHRGGVEEAEIRLDNIDPEGYVRSRNFLNGKITYLSPYIRHGILTLDRVRKTALSKIDKPAKIEKFIQELAWRDFWQRKYYEDSNCIWFDIEPYKTGFSKDDYADELPDDIAHGETGVACIDQFIHTLLDSGYMHNHTRMYVAAYVIHWRQIKWQAGARWFLHHLIDGDAASNNLSWQWIASTFSNKPYIFNLENVRKYANKEINTCSHDNQVLDASYETLSKKLFPNMQSQP